MAGSALLPDFEGHPVRQVGITIPGVAGGLRDAVKIDPIAYGQGERVFVVIEATVQSVKHEPIDVDEPAGDQRRVHTFKVLAATMVEGSLVSEHLARHRERVQRAADTAKGQGRLPTDQELQAAHAEGEHESGLVAGCPACDSEAAAVEQERVGPDEPVVGVSSLAGRRSRGKVAK